MAVELTKFEESLFQRARQGDLNAFSSHFFQLPHSGTRYTPEDRVEDYEVLFNLWGGQGKPDREFSIRVGDRDMQYRVEWDQYYGGYPVFLFPHGYLFLPWALEALTSGVDILIAEGGTGSAKCLPAGTLVQCTDGSRRPIEEIRTGDRVIGIDGNYKLREQTVTGLFRNGRKPIIKVTLNLGQELLCTPNHPLLTILGWVEAGHLKEGDHVAVPRTLPCHGEKTLRDEELILLGLLLGDGCLCRKRGSPYFTNTNVILQTLFLECVAAMSPDFKTRRTHSKDRPYTLAVTDMGRGRTNRFTDWCKKMGINGLNSHQKYVPEVVFSQSRDAVSLFLNSLYACDGYTSMQSGRPIVSYTSVSYKLVEDVQALLLRFGIISRIRRRVAVYKEKVYYTLTIDSMDHVRTFLEEIGIYGKDDSEVYKEVTLSNDRRSGSEDVIPKKDVRPYVKQIARERGTPLCKKLPDGTRPHENFRMRKNPTRWKLKEYADWLDDQWLRDLSESDVYWARIVAVECVAEDETYNLEVGPDHNFIVNGVITHNTSTVGISGIMACALYPGCSILNVAPTQHQATDMLDEITKWVDGSEFEKFVVRRGVGKTLFSQKPFPTMQIDVHGIQSSFGCMTLGQHGNFVLGKDKDRVSCDEAALVQGLDDEQPKLITRMRGTRPTGLPRGVPPYVLFITNPHPGNFGWENLKDKAQRRMKEKGRKVRWHFVRPATEENVYITRRQMNLQEEFLDEEQQRRWHKGQDDMFETQGTIPIVGIDECHRPYLDDALEELRDGGGPYEYREGMGCIHYEFPPHDDKTWRYLVMGDPGTANVTPRANNVPTVGVLDIQGWPRRPAILVAFRMIDGGGKYNAWVTEIARMIFKYRAVMGAFDATGYGKSFEEWPELEQLPLFPVSLAGGNKATARTSFNLFAGNGLFAWPRIGPVWAQAGAYRETGVGVNKIPDDVISTLFVGTFYLRYEFWDELSRMFPHLAGETRPEKYERTGDAKKKGRSRYGRRGRRYRASRRGKTDPHMVPE